MQRNFSLEEACDYIIVVFTRPPSSQLSQHTGPGVPRTGCTTTPAVSVGAHAGTEAIRPASSTSHMLPGRMEKLLEIVVQIESQVPRGS